MLSGTIIQNLMNLKLDWRKNMKHNLFIQLCKYKMTEFVTPLENFCTEALVWLIEHLLECDKRIGDKILQLFGINESEKISIETQVTHYIKNNNHNCKLIPDIHIKTDSNKHVFIEVKVDSGLHESNISCKDQLDDYNLLKNERPNCEVYSLTKFDLSTESINSDHQKKWSDIYKILAQSQDELVKQFRKFMEDNDMEGFQALKFDISRIKSEQNNFNDILRQAFEESELNGTYVLDEKRYIYADGNGWYVNKKNNEDNKAHFWFGVIPNDKSFISKILFEVLQHSVKDYEKICFEKEKDYCNNIIIDDLDLDKEILAQKLSREEQIQKVKDWLNDINKQMNA